ncbi:DUF6680 family protein [Polynucleobacter sp. es-MAR-4]|uniref:DUF6680 family protein n=1 Tax=Polynucleobacter sp. es-MAR-4 TaxID=1855655 RepID=UPI001C0AE82E|nr:DUF6680 family protein [Polynucleobacter sp. es-MAR-4]MBU3636081.1 hypothetical protein [Polynucleobacter sp. es-MAR-4]
MTGGDWAIVFATLMGPVLAVQAQKWIEALRKTSEAKDLIFKSLMATRGARLSPEHVRALNMIDLTFYGKSAARRTKMEQNVLDAWREYLDHLYEPFPQDDAKIKVVQAHREELITNLLSAIASERGFKFDRVQLKKGSYMPIGFEEQDRNQKALLESAVKVFKGERALLVINKTP